ncbi:MAG: Lrp/AsnC family transcriptional regulator [Halieaceae bacterium]|jgi:siroheme decarboxylase|nr:Lrp/AsnC family transcriptional regulator [Halieaceae bacterium]
MATDSDLIRAMQAGLPLCPEPYAEIAARLDIDELELHRRVNQLMSTGTIRRIGLVPNHYKIGYRFNAMTVWALNDEDVDEVGELFGRQTSVSHCYKRPTYPPSWPYNLFAMVHGRTLDEVNQKVESLKGLVGERCKSTEVLFSEKILKKTGLRLNSGRTENA